MEDKGHAGEEFSIESGATPLIMLCVSFTLCGRLCVQLSLAPGWTAPKAAFTVRVPDCDSLWNWL